MSSEAHGVWTTGYCNCVELLIKTGQLFLGFTLCDSKGDFDVPEFESKVIAFEYHNGSG